MSSIILGEIGESISLINNNDYANTLESIIQEYKLQKQDIIVINQKGNIIDKAPSETEITNSDRFYLFLKNSNKELILSIIDSIIKKIISSISFPLTINQNNLPDVHSNYGLIESASSYLKYIEASDIKLTFEKMLEFFENFKIIYSTMKLNNHIMTKIKENYQHQYYSINLLMKYINLICENCDLSMKEVINEYNKMIEIKENSLKKHNDAIEKLKITEIHPRLQSNNKKYLIDLYYDMDKISSWKDQLKKDASHISESIKEKSNIYYSEKNKIIEKNKITSIKNEISSLNNEFDNKLNDYEKKPHLIFNELSDDFLQFKNALIKIIDFLTIKVVDNGQKKNIISNENIDKSFDEACTLIKNLKNKYNSFNILTNLQNELEPLNDLASKMRKGLENFSLKINQISISFLENGNNLNVIYHKFNHYKKRILGLNDSFIQLENPYYFPQAYEASIEEIKRRITFNHSLTKDIFLLNKQVEKENKNRKSFIQNYGKYLPLDFFPCLKFANISLSCKINNGDELKKLPELLDDEDLDKTKTDSMNFDLIIHNDLKKINSEIKANKNDDAIEKDKLDKIMQFLKNEYIKTEESFEKISENFNDTILIKDKELKEKISQHDNLLKFINSKTNNKLDNCPMCYECVLNSKEYQTWDAFSKDIKKKLNEKESIIKQLEDKYKNLVIQTNQLKKTFFTHMNTIISQKNAEMQNKFKENKIIVSTNYETEIQKLKELLETEKNKNNNLINDCKRLQAKFENSVEEFKKLESRYELNKNKLSITNEKLSGIIKENQNIKLDKENLLLEKETILKNLLRLENLLKISQSENNDLKLTKNNLNNQLEIIGKELQNNKKQNEEEILTLKQKINEFNNLNDNYIQYKNLTKDKRCIFVPQSEGVYACINLSDDLYPNDENKKEKFFKCNYLLDMSSFDEDMRNLIVENSLIVIGIVGEYNEYDTKLNNNPLELPESNFNNNSSVYQMIKLKEVDYIIGFPGEELIFRNYNKLSFDDTI